MLSNLAFSCEMLFLWQRGRSGRVETLKATGLDTFKNKNLLCKDKSVLNLCCKMNRQHRLILIYRTHFHKCATESKEGLLRQSHIALSPNIVWR
jgi:hypothetical protein